MNKINEPEKKLVESTLEMHHKQLLNVYTIHN